MTLRVILAANGARAPEPVKPRVMVGRMARTRSRLLVPIVLVLLFISGIFGALGLWAARQFLETESWETMSSELIADPAIQTQIADTVTDAIFEGANVQAAVAGALPPRLAPLAGPASAALRDGSRRVVLRALKAPKVQHAWTVAVTTTHEQALNLIEGEGKAIRLDSGGGVIIDLRPLTGDVAQKVGLPPSIVDKIPSDATRIKVVQSDALAKAQNYLKWFKRLVVLFIVLVPLLSILAVAISPPGARRGATLAVAATVALSALVVFAFHRMAGEWVVEEISGGGPTAAAAQSVWDISTSLMTVIAGRALILAVLLGIGALLAGPSRIAVKIRSWLAPALAHEPLAIHGVVIGVAFALIATGILPFVDRPLGVVLLLATLVAATELVRRADDVPELAAVSEAAAAEEAAERSQAAAQVEGSGSGSSDLADEDGGKPSSDPPASAASSSAE